MTPAAAASSSLWHVALYIRLSREDGNDESLSVTNQRKILHEYLEHGFSEPYLLVGEYIDDGATGTDDERPGFQRLLSDIRRGAVDCVMCKTLSRAFRNYADQGYFLEEFFPRHRTRFIALSGPRVDSFLDPDAVNGYEIPISGIINDRYAGRTSLDVRRTLDTKRRRGEFIGAFAPYGYQKDPADHSRLAEDPSAARVVRDIFHWYVHEGLSKQGIARRLNQLGVPNPAHYKRRCGLRYFHPHAGENDGLWSPRTVSYILDNPVYAGDLVQGRQRVVSYKVHDRVSVPPSEWFVVLDAHPPLVSRALFALARERAARTVRAAPGADSVHLFAGVLFCAGCGKAMGLKSVQGGRYRYYVCRTHREKGGCSSRHLRADAVERAVLDAIRSQIARLPKTEITAAAEAVRAAPCRRDGPAGWETLRRENARQAARLQSALDGLYLDWRQGLLTQEDFSRLRRRLEGQLDRLRAASIPPETEASCSPAVEDFLTQGNFLRLERGVVAELIDRILVEEDGGLEIRFRFADPGALSSDGSC